MLLVLNYELPNIPLVVLQLNVWMIIVSLCVVTPEYTCINASSFLSSLLAPIRLSFTAVRQFAAAAGIESHRCRADCSCQRLTAADVPSPLVPLRVPPPRL